MPNPEIGLTAYKNKTSKGNTMMRGKWTGIATAIIAGIIFLAGCESSPEIIERTVGPNNLIVTVYSPVANKLYNLDEQPELTYSVTEGLENTNVPDSRLSAQIVDMIDGDATNPQKLAELYSGVKLPQFVDGTHRLEFTVHLESGDSFTTGFLFETDFTPPVLTVAAPAEGGLTNNRNPVLEYTIDEPCFAENTCEEIILLDGEATTARNGDPLPTLTDGTHKIEIIFKDEAGNKNSVTLSFVVDATPPQVLIVSPTIGVTNDPTPVLEYTIDDPCFASGSCQETVILDGQQVTATSGQTLPTLNDGTHTVVVEYVDQAGNAASDSFQFTVDSTPPVIDPPVVMVLAPSDNTTTNISSPALSYTINQACFTTSTCGEIVTLNGTEITTRNGGALPTLANGTYTIQVSMTGEGGTGSDTNTFTVDVAAPPPPDTAAPVVTGDAIINETTATLAFVSSEDGTAEISLDNTVLATVNVIAGVVAEYSLTNLTSGHRSIGVVVSDASGNASQPLAITLTVDITAPTVNIYKPVGIYPTKTVPLDVVYSDDLTSKNNLKVDVTLAEWDAAGGVWIAADAQVVDLPGGMVTVAQDGKYRVSVAVTDAANNTSRATSIFTVDTTPPLVQIATPADGSTVTTSTPMLDVYVNETINYGMSTFVFSGGYVDTFDRVTTSTGIGGGEALKQPNGTPLSDGVWTVVVEMKDDAGNIGWEYSTFTVNAVGPAVSITKPADGDQINNGKVTLHFRANEFTSVEVWVKRDGSSESPTPLTVVPVENPAPRNNVYSVQLFDLMDFFTGSYTIRTVAVDASGLHQPSESFVKIHVNTEKPALSITSPNDGSRYYPADTPVQVTFDVSNYNTLEATEDYRAVSGNLESGSFLIGPYNQASGQFTRHTVAVKAINDNGELSDSEIFYIDTNAPRVAIDSPANGTVFAWDTNVALYYSVADDMADSLSSSSLKLNGQVVNMASGSSLGTLAAGNYTLTLTGVDKAGNETTATSLFTVEAYVPPPPPPPAPEPEPEPTPEPEEDDDDDDDVKGKSSCHLEAIKGDDDKRLELVKCTSNKHSKHNRDDDDDRKKR